ncbi:MAG: ADP-ribosylation factor family-domain-containing protein [Linnemannia gamsii]|nr:MAG: ADP-ribosylation factor family-domain-containing protein [Linnemannia gamsii]
MLRSLSNLLSKKGRPKPDAQGVIMLGFCNAGKTSILYRLFLNELVTTIPTPVHSFNKQTVTLPSNTSSSFSSQGMTKYTFYDHSGNLGAIRFWHKFMKEGGPVIFVVDSTDPGSFYEAQEALRMAYLEYENDNNVQGGILLVLCNKQDCPDAASVEDIKSQLGLEDTWMWGRRWHIRGVSAKTGEGIWEAMDWLETQLSGPALPTISMKRSSVLSHKK